MAIVQIPVNTDTADYAMRVDLDGTTFSLSFRYNERDGFWYMGVADAAEVPIRTGIRLVLGATYLRLVRDARRPGGELASIDNTASGTEAGATDFGTRVVLLYAGQEDVEEALA